MKYLITLLICTAFQVAPHKHRFTIPEGCNCKCMDYHGNYCSVKGCRAKQITYDWDIIGDSMVSFKERTDTIFPGNPKYFYLPDTTKY